jgi:hypothetical protein
MKERLLILFKNSLLQKVLILLFILYRIEVLLFIIKDNILYQNTEIYF